MHSGGRVHTPALQGSYRNACPPPPPGCAVVPASSSRPRRPRLQGSSAPWRLTQSHRLITIVTHAWPTGTTQSFCSPHITASNEARGPSPILATSSSHNKGLQRTAKDFLQPWHWWTMARRGPRPAQTLRHTTYTATHTTYTATHTHTLCYPNLPPPTTGTYRPAAVT